MKNNYKMPIVRMDDEEEEPACAEEKEKGTEVNEMVEQKLLENRQIFLWGAVDDDTAKDLVSKLLYLEATKPGAVRPCCDAPG